MAEQEIPTDPEFRSAFVSYIEWGSQSGVAPSLDEPMPRWGWGEAKRPYRADA